MRNKQVTELVEKARDQGWRVALNKAGHWRFAPPSGRLVFTGSTPSDRRAFKNLQKDLMRQGLKLAT